MKQFLIQIFAPIVLVSIIVFGSYRHGVEVATVKCAGEQSSELLRIQGERDDLQLRVNAMAHDWAEDKARSESSARSTADSLRESGVRLRVKLADATIEATQGYNRGLTDGRAELHRETGEALIRITQDADRHVKALQDTLKEVTQ